MLHANKFYELENGHKIYIKQMFERCACGEFKIEMKVIAGEINSGKWKEITQEEYEK